MYVLGPATTGGLCAYEVGSGTLAGSYSEGHHYHGLYQLPSGALLAAAAGKPAARVFLFRPQPTRNG